MSAENAQAMQENVILVDGSDRAVGCEDKLIAHQHGLLHRAVSVFLIEPSGAILLQRRASSKYHSAGSWSNSCCGHPRPGESVIHAAERRTTEELGVHAQLEFVARLQYRCEVEPQLVEHEVVHLFVGHIGSRILSPDPREVAEVDWMSGTTLLAHLAQSSFLFSPWLQIYAKCLSTGDRNSLFAL